MEKVNANAGVKSDAGVKKKSDIERLIEQLRHLIQIGHPIAKCIRYPKLLVSALQELDGLVEMKEIKSAIVRQLQFLIVSQQGNSSDSSKKDNKFQGHLLHTVIYGEPGVGKTKCAVILTKLYTALGLLKTNPDPPPEPKAMTTNMTNAITEKLREAFLVTRILELQSTVVSQQNRLKRIRESAMKQRESLRRVRRRTLRHHPYSRDREVSPNDSVNENEEMSDLLHDIKDVQYGLDDIIKEATIAPDDMEEDTEETPDEPVGFPGLPGLSLIIRPPGQPGETNSIVKPPSLPISISAPIGPPPFPSVSPVPATPKEEKEPEEIPIVITGRHDFVAEYVGHTAIKTEALLKKNLGKVVFIDEAYLLFEGERDTFGMEALTTLNRFMSEHAHEIIIIMAGYRSLMQETIFRAQPGLRRRCGWVFEIKGYSAKGLSEIFALQLKQHGWSVSPNLNMEAFFSRNMKKFEGFGGDTEKIGFYSKLVYATVKFNEAYESIVAGSNIKFDNVITKEILEEALLSLENNDANKEDELPEIYRRMIS